VSETNPVHLNAIERLDVDIEIVAVVEIRKTGFLILI
jgi:hypothetical protein